MCNDEVDIRQLKQEVTELASKLDESRDDRERIWRSLRDVEGACLEFKRESQRKIDELQRKVQELETRLNKEKS